MQRPGVNLYTSSPIQRLRPFSEKRRWSALRHSLASRPRGPLPPRRSFGSSLSCYLPRNMSPHAVQNNHLSRAYHITYPPTNPALVMLVQYSTYTRVPRSFIKADSKKELPPRISSPFKTPLHLIDVLYTLLNRVIVDYLPANPLEPFLLICLSS
jgi:hypothetical protein